MLELRPYQQECVKQVLAEYKQDRHGGALLVLPTGAGKTIVFCDVIKRLDLNTLIIAHRDELLDQAAEKYHQVKPDAIIGKVGSGIHEYSDEVTVASIATISRPEQIKHLQAISYEFIIIDEAHHAAADGYQRVLEALPDAFVLMVTATPDRLDGQDIIDKPPLYECTIIDMIAQGYLCDVRAIAIRTETSLDAIHTRMGDFSERELDLAVNTPARNMRVVESYQEHAPGRTAICFAVTVAHAYALADTFNESGIPAATVTGETPIEERKHLYQALRSGKIQVLTNVQVLTEGFDEPLVDCVIMARPTQSRALYVQCIGRGLRIAPAKKDCLILDLTDNCFRHRLQPQSLEKALGKSIKDRESIQEALLREAEAKEAAAAEREEQVRTLRVQRAKDVQINLLEKLDWKRRDTGVFVLEVGKEKHRIALIPSKTRPGYYTVAARLAPDFQMQSWSSEQPLGWAQQVAEKRAKMLQADGTKRVLFDKNAPWRRKPVDPESKQAEQLRKFDVSITPLMTKGEAADILAMKYAQLERGRRAS